MKFKYLIGFFQPPPVDSFPQALSASYQKIMQLLSEMEGHLNQICCSINTKETVSSKNDGRPR